MPKCGMHRQGNIRHRTYGPGLPPRLTNGGIFSCKGNTVVLFLHARASAGLPLSTAKSFFMNFMLIAKLPKTMKAPVIHNIPVEIPPCLVLFYFSEIINFVEM